MGPSAVPVSYNARRSLETTVCDDLGIPAANTATVIARSALGPAAPQRYVAINTGAVGRTSLLWLLAWSRGVLDADMRAPAPWRGPSRNAHARRRRENTAWLLPAFADVVGTSVRSSNIARDDLVRWNLLAEGPGRWRTGTARVDGHEVRFSPEQAVVLVDGLLARANRRSEPAPLAAARLHLGLLLVHPFGDGNGRTARLAAAAVLLRDGTRTSLLTCVEQHYHLAPKRYAAMMGRIRRGEISADRVIDDLLGAMAGRCVLAAWVRHRQRLLLERAVSLDHSDPVTAVRCFEFGDCASPLETHGGQQIEPWHRLRPHLHPDIERELRSQLGRAIGDR